MNVDIVVRPSWRLASGRWACSAGSQMRRTATPPLSRKEVDPGVAIKLVTSQAHPFCLPAVFPQPLETALDVMRNSVDHIQTIRTNKLKRWRKRAEDLLPRTLELIEQTSDPHLRRFFKRGVPVGQQPKLGKVCHLALWEEVFKASNSTDHLFLNSMSAGFPLRGPIERSNTWEPILPELWPHFNPEELANRAWGTSV